MERQVNRSIQNEQRARERGARSAEQLQEKRFRELSKSLDKEAREAEKAEARKAAAAEKLERWKIRLQNNSVRMAQRAAEDELRARERVEQQKLNIQLNSARMAGRIAAQQVREESALRNRVTGALAGQVVGSVRGAIGTVAKVGGSILALGGGFSAADAVQTSIVNSGKARQLELNSNGAVKKDQVLSTAADVGSSMGTSTESVIDALDAFVAKSGDVKSGLSAIREIAELAAATGADMKDLATVAGQAQTGTKDIRSTMDILREIAGMGRAGSVDVRELSQYGSRIFAGASKFENQRAATTTIGAMVQAAAAGSGGATGAAEASEFAPHIAADIFKNEEGFKALNGGKGVRIRSKKNNNLLGDLKQIVKDTLVATGGDMAQLQPLFGERSIKGVAGAANAYNRAGQGLTGKEAITAKLAAVEAVFAEFEKAGLKDAQVKEEASRRIQEADKQLEIVLNQLREAVGRELVPELIKLIPQIRQLIPAFVDLLKTAVSFAEWFANNPISGLGAVVLASVTKDLAGAGIGAAVKAALVAMMGGTAAPGAAAAIGGRAGLVASGGSGLLAMAGAAGIGGVLGVGAGIALTERASNAQTGASSNAVSGLLGNENAIAASAGQSPADRLASQRAALAKVAADIETVQKSKADAGPGLLVNLLGRAQNAVGIPGADIGEAQASEQATYGRILKDLNEQMVRLKDSIKLSEAALRNHAETTTKAPKPQGDPARVVSGANPTRASR